MTNNLNSNNQLLELIIRNIAACNIFQDAKNDMETRHEEINLMKKLHAIPHWKINSEQKYSRPRDWRLLESLRAPHKPLEHQRSMVPTGLMGELYWASLGQEDYMQ